MHKITRIIFNNIGLVCSLLLILSNEEVLIVLGILGIVTTMVQNIAWIIMWIIGYDGNRNKENNGRRKNDKIYT